MFLLYNNLKGPGRHVPYGRNPALTARPASRSIYLKERRLGTGGGCAIGFERSIFPRTGRLPIPNKNRIRCFRKFLVERESLPLIHNVRSTGASFIAAAGKTVAPTPCAISMLFA